jgi:hypothetical protein
VLTRSARVPTVALEMVSTILSSLLLATVSLREYITTPLEVGVRGHMGMYTQLWEFKPDKWNTKDLALHVRAYASQSKLENAEEAINNIDYATRYLQKVFRNLSAWQPVIRSGLKVVPGRRQ